MLNFNYKIALCLPLAFALSGCVATRKHVKSVSDPLDRRLGGLEAKSRETDTKLEAHDKGIAAVDERAKAADQHAGLAEKEAKAAHERIGQVSEKTDAAGRSATEARAVADQGLNKAGAVDSRLTQSLASLENFQVVSTQNVLFAFAKSNLSDEATKQLDEAATAAMKQKRYVIEVQGFTDKSGNTDSNLTLSRERADQVVRYLTMQHKIPLYRIYQLGAGSTIPVGDDKTREGRKQNRRVEIRVFSADTDSAKVTAQAN